MTVSVWTSLRRIHQENLQPGPLSTHGLPTEIWELQMQDHIKTRGVWKRYGGLGWCRTTIVGENQHQYTVCLFLLSRFLCRRSCGFNYCLIVMSLRPINHIKSLIP